MASINPYSTGYIHNTSYSSEKIDKKDINIEKKELTRDEIISSKELSMGEKLNLLNITKMSPEELAKGVADKLLGL